MRYPTVEAACLLAQGDTTLAISYLVVLRYPVEAHIDASFLMIGLTMHQSLFMRVLLPHILSESARPGGSMHVRLLSLSTSPYCLCASARCTVD